jgi:hypothetical protein
VTLADRGRRLGDHDGSPLPVRGDAARTRVGSEPERRPGRSGTGRGAPLLLPFLFLLLLPPLPAGLAHAQRLSLDLNRMPAGTRRPAAIVTRKGGCRRPMAALNLSLTQQWDGDSTVPH